MKTIQAFIRKHMKSNDISIGKYLNLYVWKHGMQNPPHHAKVNAVKNEKGKVFVEMVGAPKEKPKVETKKTTKKEEVKDAEFKEVVETKLEQHVHEVKEEKAKEAQEIEKEEIKELQKEHPKQHPPKIPKRPKQEMSRPTAPKSV